MHGATDGVLPDGVEVHVGDVALLAKLPAEVTQLFISVLCPKSVYRRTSRSAKSSDSVCGSFWGTGGARSGS